jgi:hypothetical protein
MRRLLVVSVLAASVSGACAIDFVTTDGLSYSNATVKRVEPDGITVSYPSGIVKIDFSYLPDEVRQQYNYDPKKAADYRAAQNKLRAEAAKAQQAVLRQAAEKDAKQKKEASDLADKSATMKRLKKEASKGVVELSISGSYQIDDGWVCNASSYTSANTGKKDTSNKIYTPYGQVFVVGLSGFFYGKSCEGKLYPAGTYNLTILTSHVPLIPYPDGTYSMRASHASTVVLRRFATTPELAAQTLMNEMK